MPKGDKLLAIDLLRFLCAGAVVAHHYVGGWSLQNLGEGTVDADPGAWTAAGWVGVQLFFVVSGYVITMSAQGSRAGAFLRRRVLRLVPGAWIAASLTALLLVGVAGEPLSAIVPRWSASIVFWPIARQIDPSYWTLGLETVFYLLVAALLGRVRTLEPLALLLAGGSLAYWLSAGAWQASADHWYLLDLTLLPHGAYFATGIALYGAASGGWSWRRATIVAIGVVVATCEIPAQARAMDATMGTDGGALPPLLIFTAGVLAVVFAPRLQPAVRWAARPVAFMGAVSYPLYLIHQRAGVVLIEAARRRGVDTDVATWIVAAAMLGVAAIVAAWGEPMLRRWLAARIDAFRPRRDLAPDSPRSAFPPAG